MDGVLARADRDGVREQLPRRLGSAERSEYLGCGEWVHVHLSGGRREEGGGGAAEHRPRIRDDGVFQQSDGNAKRSARVGARYGVIDGGGKVMYQVRLPERVHLDGFGKNTLYTTPANEDDPLTLRRHSASEVKLKG